VDDRSEFGVPAGWYPDPLGLPQLRWWDSLAWTEHTSEARAPIVIQPSTRLAWADDELPSRREQRERERREAESDPLVETDAHSGELSAQPLLAMTLKELEPPLEDTMDDFTPGPRRASAHTNHYGVSESGLPALAEELEPTDRGPRRGTRTYTAAVWIIALMPVLQLAASIVLLLTGFGHNLPLMILVWIAPYAIVLGLAAYDRLELRSIGHQDPASPRWAFLTAPGYLILRAIHTVRETGVGFAPLIAWTALSALLFAAIIAFPGLLISVMPGVFSAEIERSVTADAASLGADLTVSCPESPPVLMGELFTCRASKPSGATDSIAVSLQRENGWIAWRVEDWGLWVLTDR
jgi:hypothetical protein